MFGLSIVVAIFSSFVLMIYAFGNEGRLSAFDFLLGCLSIAILVGLSLFVNRESEHN